MGRWGRRLSSGLSECQHLDADCDDDARIVMMRIPEGVNNVCGNFEQGHANYKRLCLCFHKIGEFVSLLASDASQMSSSACFRILMSLTVNTENLVLTHGI